MLGFALYGLAHFYTMVSHDPIIKHTKKCKYCRQRINEKVCRQKVCFELYADMEQAARCIHCTSWLDGREDAVQS